MAGKKHDNKAKRKRAETDMTKSDDVTAKDDESRRSAKSSRRDSSRSNLPAEPSVVAQNRAASNHQQDDRRERPFTTGFSAPAQSHSDVERAQWLADDEGDIDELVASSQAVSNDNDHLFLYGDLPTKVVGIQHYTGLANQGEHILVRREPGNPYDSNAIRIDNVSAAQIGHIPRRMAEKLAKYIDNRW
jgi:SWI/SNF-related matrix-associated actin-dependent regulator of chromatin subfamily A3